jgi:hypothetical protein
VHRLTTELFVGTEFLWGKAERLDGASAGLH